MFYGAASNIKGDRTRPRAPSLAEESENEQSGPSGPLVQAYTGPYVGAARLLLDKPEVNLPIGEAMHDIRGAVESRPYRRGGRQLKL